MASSLVLLAGDVSLNPGPGGAATGPMIYQKSAVFKQHILSKMEDVRLLLRNFRDMAEFLHKVF